MTGKIVNRCGVRVYVRGFVCCSCVRKIFFFVCGSEQNRGRIESVRIILYLMS